MWQNRWHYDVLSTQAAGFCRVANSYVLLFWVNSIIYYDTRDNSTINVTNNHIYFNATINDNSINNLIKCINNIIELKNKDYDKTIILHINSMGGKQNIYILIV